MKKGLSQRVEASMRFYTFVGVSSWTRPVRGLSCLLAWGCTVEEVLQERHRAQVVGLVRSDCGLVKGVSYPSFCEYIWICAIWRA